jgi:hypothetical protein
MSSTQSMSSIWVHLRLALGKLRGIPTPSPHGSPIPDSSQEELRRDDTEVCRERQLGGNESYTITTYKLEVANCDIKFEGARCLAQNGRREIRGYIRVEYLGLEKRCSG